MISQPHEQPALVACGSRYGATAEIAEHIGAVLREQGLPVQVSGRGGPGTSPSTGPP